LKNGCAMRSLHIARIAPGDLSLRLTHMICSLVYRRFGAGVLGMICGSPPHLIP
jgi:hypothetical protein